MNPNVRGSELVALRAAIPPAVVAPGTVQTSWIPVSETIRMLAVVNVGAMAANATLDIKIQQAQDINGTGAKDVKSAAQLLAANNAGGNAQILLDLAPSREMDANGNFNYVRLVATVGSANVALSAELLSVVGMYYPASVANATTVAQIVT